MKQKLPILIAALLGAAACGRAAENWVERAVVEQPSGNLVVPVRWDPATGLQLSLGPTNGRSRVIVELSRKECALRFTPPDAFSECTRASGQFNPAALPDRTLPTVELLLKLRDQAWMVYIDNRPVAAFAVPFAPPFSVSHPSPQLPEAEAVGTFFQKSGSFTFTDDFLVPEEEENKLGAWEIESGAWGLHTVVDDVVERDLIKPNANEKPTVERSPNFYSLRGAGTNAQILAGYDFYDWYDLEAALRIATGEMGLVFHKTEQGFHALTLTRSADDPYSARLQLWRAETDATNRTVLAAANVRVTDGQWVKLKVRIFLNRLHGYMDNTRVFDLAPELPPGGRFGLFANAAKPVLFDDVKAVSNHDLDFGSAADLLRHVAAEDGTFLKKSKAAALLRDAREPVRLSPRKDDRWQHLMLGATDTSGGIFAADFKPRGNEFTIGLVDGYQGPDLPFYRFVCSRHAAGETYRLETVSTNITVLEELTLSDPPALGPDRSFNLKSDASDPHALRLYRDGRLVLIHHPRAEVRGAAGPAVGPLSEVEIEDPSCYSQPRDVYRNAFEKNRLFIEDPFMRHWSSPEGQWITTPDKLTWYKGDFFGRLLVRLPFLPNTELHLGVDEHSNEGAMVVRTDGEALKLFAGDQALTEAPLITLPRSALAPQPDDAPELAASRHWYTVEADGYWLWISSGGTVLAKQQLAQPFQGTRLRIAGFSAEQLTHSYVERYNVKDYLFTESLHEWTINGGQWEVVNRFNCRPDWSHMNGESAQSLAALWSKYTFSGNFCVEMYAGLRHGWYERCGDLNLTVMNALPTPSQGYTVTCTGWDFDNSQLYTRLLRNGQVIAESDKYLVPRKRDDNERRGYNPLVSSGRDVHGAWYYLKLRRIGNKLQYFFDNELVFEATDNEMLTSGSLGLWTFMNSMMIARVKMAAEEISPRPVPFEMLAAEGRAEPHQAAAQADWDAVYAGVLNHEAPVTPLRRTAWQARDDVSRLRLDWRVTPDGAPYFATENVLGSGSFQAACDLPLVPLQELAGWTFRLKRTPGALFNFHYSIGHLDKDGQFAVDRSFFHRISGSTFSEGPRRMAGATDVPPSDAPDWPAVGAWTTVHAHVDRAQLRDLPNARGLLVRVEGFGNLQPSYELQGIEGNAPGTGYAVKDYAEIRYGPPRLSTRETPPVQTLALLDPASGATLVSAAGTDEIQNWLDQHAAPGLRELTLKMTCDDETRSQPLVWIELPEQMDIACAWSAQVPDAAVFTLKADYPDPRFSAARLLANGSPVFPDRETMQSRIARLPLEEALVRDNTNNVTLTLVAEPREYSFQLDPRLCPLSEPPALLRLEGLSPLFENFEARAVPQTLSTEGRMASRNIADETSRGRFLDVSNAGNFARLQTVFGIPGGIPIARYPLAQWRYRAGPMANISFALGQAGVARLSEAFGNARGVRGAEDVKLDGQWHTWQGFVSDAVGSLRLNPYALTINDVAFKSMHSNDQTGLYTHFNVDELVLGPAVADGNALTFTPHYFDLDGITEVALAVRAGAEPHDMLNDEQRAALPWQTITNKGACTPDISALPDGVCHLFLKAVDRRGQTSFVTDVPFLVDRTPLQAAYAFETSDTVTNNGTKLRITIATGGGAPLRLDELKLKWQDEEVRLRSFGSSLQHSEADDTLLLNWPYLVRRQLDRTEDGQTYNISIAGISDGAGNRADDLVVPCKIDYASDHTSPTLLRADFPSNVLWTTSYDLTSDLSSDFKRDTDCEASTRRDDDGEPYIRMTAGGGRPELRKRFQRNGWSPNEYPYLAFRMRLPQLKDNDKPQVSLTFATQRKGSQTLLLTDDGDQRQLSASFRLKKEEGRWQSAVLDLREILGRVMTEDQLKREAIRELQVTLGNFRNKQSLDIQSLFVFSAWTDVDQLELNAYDASGIAGLTWGVEKRDSATTLLPSRILSDDPDMGWLIARVRDKAGNASIPVRIPLFDASRLMAR